MVIVNLTHKNSLQKKGNKCNEQNCMSKTSNKKSEPYFFLQSLSMENYLEMDRWEILNPY